MKKLILAAACAAASGTILQILQIPQNKELIY